VGVFKGDSSSPKNDKNAAAPSKDTENDPPPR
jgi:hypothetical protein